MALLTQSIEPSPAPGHVRVVAGQTGPHPGPAVAGGRPLPRRQVGHRLRRAMRPTAHSDRVPVATWLRSVVRPRPSDRIGPGLGLLPARRDNGRVGNGPDRPRRPLGRPATVISVLAAAWITTGCGSSDAGPPGSGPAASAAASSSAEASTAAAEFARNTPPAAARMICDDEIRGEIADALGVVSLPAGQSGWADHVYTCTYAPPMGQLVLSVTVAPSDAAADKALAGMRAGLPNAAPDSGLGQESYRSDAGTVVAVKDNMVLRVDATGMPDDLGTVHERRVDLARTVAGGVFNCWTGNS